MKDSLQGTEGAGGDIPVGESGGSMTAGTGTPAVPPGNAPRYRENTLVQGLYAIILLIVLIATLQLYFAIQDIINRWFSYEYIPIFNSLYFIAVISGGVSLIWLRIARR
jgi:hypothetical protein